MNYNSWTFWLLFLVVIVPYWRLNHRRQNQLLLVVSYLFYGFWDYRFLFLVLISTAIDFIGGLGVAGVRLSPARLWRLSAFVIGSCALLCKNIQYPMLYSGLIAGDVSAMAAAMPRTWSDFSILIGVTVVTLGYQSLLPWLYARPEDSRRKLFVWISMVANLAILGYFKYCDFFIVSMRQALEAVGLGHWGGSALGILLPAGISFYTFQAMSYTIDVYRREIEPTDDFCDFALFVCFFPHLVAGPIMRAHTLLPQVVRPRHMKPGDFEEGLFLVVMGLVKKVVIADNMAPLADNVFLRFANGTGSTLSGPEVLIGVYAFAFQIYGDFSGYSSVARGISKWLGFDLAINFRLPYLAVSPSDFWRRWHISLSSWLRDYLYIPLGGNKHGEWLTYRNLMLTMLLGGLWHGASWTFVAWGLYHGLILCLFRWLGINDPKPEGSLSHRLYWLFRVACMFHLTCFGWLLFRADSFGTVVAMLQAMTSDLVLTPTAIATLATIVFHCGLLFALEWLLDGEQKLERFTVAPSLWRGATYAYMASMLLIFHAKVTAEFIYFQF